ncbi:MAG: ATP-grasp domain-containing protein [Saccharofermentanales bacterium]|jgi:biotin carboxylase
MKRVLIIGASILQLPAIKRAKELGYYVAVADYNVEAIGIPHADEYFNVSTVDIDGIVRIANNFKPDGIMTLATDMPMRAVAKACEVRGLLGISYDTAVKATDKGEMIKAFEAHGVEHPWYHIVENRDVLETMVTRIMYPCIMKPTDNAGSRGVVLCHGIDELQSKYEYARRESNSGAVIIEEFLQGPEVSVEVMIVDGEPHVIQITDKLTSGAPHFIEMGHSQPSRQNATNQDLIKKLACRACKAVGIETGPAHVEMILTENGPKMVELGARMGGDCIASHLVPLSTGIDMVGSAIKQACGEKMDIDIKPKCDKGSAIRYFKSKPGMIKSIEGVEKAQAITGVREVVIVHHLGKRVGEIRNSSERIGFVIAQAETAVEAINVCMEAIQTVHFTIE